MPYIYFILGFCCGVIVLACLQWLANHGDDLDPLDGY